MEKDFHYFLIYSLAKITGYKDADVLAYASQFVDDNNEGQFSIDEEETSFPEKIKSDEGYYYPIMTQSLSPKSLDIYVQKYVYLPFHFLPGDDTVEIKGTKNRLNTTPNSNNAQRLAAVALQSDNPYQIGIALHTYADTWSHQNFTGLCEDWNALYPWYNIFKSLVPNIGHAEAGHAPDVISETWTDYRLNKKINNEERAFEATEKIYALLRGKSQSGPMWSEVQDSYQQIICTPDYDQRIEAISAFLKDRNLGKIPPYSKDVWIDAALDRKGDDIVMKRGFTETNWYKFHQAAKLHFAHVADLVKDI
jgi:hypothetical protein